MAPGRGRFRFGRALLGFAGGLVFGYCVMLFGWLAFNTPKPSLSGGDIMVVGFVFAPAAGLLAAILGAVLLGLGKRPTAQA